MGGSRSPNGVVVGPYFVRGPISVYSMSCKSCYFLLLRSRFVTPHCLAKFFLPFVGSGKRPGNPFFSFILIVKSLNLNWKVAHGMLYTGECLSDR